MASIWFPFPLVKAKLNWVIFWQKGSAPYLQRTINWRTKYSISAWLGNAGGGHRKNPLSLNFSIIDSVNSIRIDFYAACIVPSNYWHSDHCGPSGFSGLYGFPDRSGFPVVPAFWAFWLSGRSGFKVIPSFQSFRLFLFKNQFKKKTHGEQFAY